MRSHKHAFRSTTYYSRFEMPEKPSNEHLTSKSCNPPSELCNLLAGGAMAVASSGRPPHQARAPPGMSPGEQSSKCWSDLRPGG